MKKRLALAGIALGLLPITTFAAPAKMAHQMATKKTAAATVDECQKCHMKVSAAVARKDGYKDPMESGRLVPVKPGSARQVHEWDEDVV